MLLSFEGEILPSMIELSRLDFINLFADSSIRILIYSFTLSVLNELSAHSRIRCFCSFEHLESKIPVSGFPLLNSLRIIANRERLVSSVNKSSDNSLIRLLPSSKLII